VSIGQNIVTGLVPKIEIGKGVDHENEAVTMEVLKDHDLGQPALKKLTSLVEL